MAILVTGGAGYIGSVTTELLRARGEQVVVLDNLSRGHRDAVAPEVPFYEGDVGNRELVTRVVREHDVDACIHFAAFAYVGESVSAPALYYENNVEQGIRLLGALIQSDVRQIVFSSTCATYGEPQHIPIDEQHSQLPTNPYGWSKLFIERIMSDYDRSYGLKFVALRYFNAAGATSERGERHYPETHLIPLVLKAALGESDRVAVFGDDYPTKDGTCVRDYIHVSDLADAHALSLDYLRAGNSSTAVNLGNGQGYSVLEVVDAAREVTGREIEIETQPRRAGDPSHLVADASKAATVLGWKPRHPALAEIISSAWKWHSKLLVTICLLMFAFIPAQAQVQDRVQPEAHSFRLEDVRLLDGPFKHAMTRDAEYLLRLEPDRLLSGFTKEAGLTPKAQAYGGWESMTIAGHSLGHYLSACALMFASTGDPRFRERVNYIIAELERCQRANGNGYVAAIPNGKKIFQEISTGDIRVQPFDLNGGWVPWYTLHKLFAGLLDVHRYFHNTKALTIAVKLADWADSTLAKLTDEQFQRMLDCEHGGMNEVLAELYARTGNEKYLRLSRRFHHKRVLEPLAQREDRLQGLHANTQIPKLIGLARRYELTADTADKTAAEFFWQRVVHHHSYVNGGNSDGERFGPPDKLSNRLSENTSETCNTYNMLKLTLHLFGWHASAEYADYYERALYNHILASQNPDDGMVCYYVPMKAGSRKVYSKPFDDFWCCVGSGMENHAKYGEAIYFHDSAGLWVNLFIPSELTWREKGLTLRQETRYPEDKKVSFAITTRRPVDLALRLRYPGWAKDGVTVAVNGRPQTIDVKPGSFVEIKRRWKTGDRIELTIPMSLRLETMPDNPRRVAILYGPTVLAGELESEDQPGGVNLAPALVAGDSSISNWLKPATERAVTFRTAGAGRPGDVTLYPFYRMHNKRYAVYWDLLDEQQWLTRVANYKVELERVRRLEALTVDFVQPGEPQLEREHNMQGERMDTGEHSGRKWRHARDGGWLSFDLKVLPDQPLAIVCSYWGSETGPRKFDILADGIKIGTQSLGNDKPGEFFDVTYSIPEDVTRGKSKITIRFQPQAGNMAGGFYGVRVIRKQ